MIRSAPYFGYNIPYLVCSSCRPLSYSSTVQRNSDETSEKLQLFWHHSQATLNERIRWVEERGACEKCFLIKRNCICAAVRSAFPVVNGAVRAHSLKSRLEVLMHFKEWGRASNTGKLAPLALPNSSQVSIFGSETQQRNLVERLLCTRSAILYPCSTAIPISEFLKQQQQHYRLNDDSDGGEGGDSGGRSEISICVLDATWCQSKAMNKSLPAHIPRVHISSMVKAPSLFLNRKQSEDKRKVSTIEAMVFALEAMGQDTATLSALVECLNISVRAVEKQGGRHYSDSVHLIG